MCGRVGGGGGLKSSFCLSVSSLPQFEACRQLLVSIFQHPLLQRRSTLGHSLTARAKLLTARYLQYRKFDLKPSKEFLHYLLNEPCEGFEQGSFTVTALELAVEAVKVFRNLAEHHSVARCVIM